VQVLKQLGYGAQGSTYLVKHVDNSHLYALKMVVPCIMLRFYSTAAFPAIQSAVLATAIPSVCPSVCLSHAGTLSRRMKIGLRGLHCDVAKTLQFSDTTMVGGRQNLRSQ